MFQPILSSNNKAIFRLKHKLKYKNVKIKHLKAALLNFD